MKQKKIPLRKCLGCGVQKPKQELARVVKSPQGDISLDLTGKKSGRGAYICKDVSCLNKAKKAKRFEHAFDCAISEEIYSVMEKELKSGE